MTRQLEPHPGNPCLYDLAKGQGEVFKALAHVPARLGEVVLEKDQVHIVFVNDSAEAEVGLGCVGRLFLTAGMAPFAPVFAEILQKIQQDRGPVQPSSLWHLANAALDYDTFRYELLVRFNSLRGYDSERWKMMRETRKRQLRTIKAMATQKLEGKQDASCLLRLNGQSIAECDGIGAHGLFQTEFWDGHDKKRANYQTVSFEGYLGGIKIIASQYYQCYGRDNHPHYERHVQFWWRTSSDVRLALEREHLPVELINLYPAQGLF